MDVNRGDTNAERTPALRCLFSGPAINKVAMPIQAAITTNSSTRA